MRSRILFGIGCREGAGVRTTNSTAAWYKEFTEQSTLTAGTKRRYLSGSSSQHKRIKPALPRSELCRSLISCQLIVSNLSREPLSNPKSNNPNTNKILLTTGARAEVLGSPGMSK